jgi:hypothetical protein
VSTPPSKPPSSAKRLEGLIVKVSGVAAILAGALELFRVPMVQLVLQRGMALWALVILGFASSVACSLWIRGYSKERATRRAIRRVLGFAFVVLLGVAAAGWLLKPEPWLMPMFALAFCSVGRLRRRMNRRIDGLAKTFVERDTLLVKSKPLWRVSVRPPPTPHGSPSFRLVLRVPIPAWLGSRLSELHNSKAKPLHRSNKLVAFITLLGCALCITGGASAYFGRIVFPYTPTPSKASKSSSSADGPSSDGATTIKAGAGSDPAPPDETQPSRATWSSVCPSLPELGAPNWAKKELNSLYLGQPTLHANPPPGTEGGCTASATVPAWSHGSFVYTVGRIGKNELRSVAVDSHFGPAIFLVPAARRVLSLIEETEGPVGGLPAIIAGNGDVTSITTEEGSYALVRAEEHQPGRPDVASPYVELPPLVTTAWVSAMREQHSWLWPQLPRGNKQIETFSLTLDPSGGEPRASIVYEPETHTAMRNSIPYRLPTSELNEAELKHFAGLAGR